MRITKQMLQTKVDNVNSRCKTSFKYDTSCGFNRICLHGIMIYTGTKKQCLEFLDAVFTFILVSSSAKEASK